MLSGLVLLLCLPTLAWSRYEAGTLLVGTSYDENSWQYVGKFGFGVGRGTYEARIKNQIPSASATPLRLEVFLDEDWPRVKALPKCSPEVRSLSRAHRQVTADAGEEWGAWAEGSVKQSRRTHIWYFALSGCDAPSRNFTQSVDFEIHYQQADTSELSYELQLMPYATLLAVVCLSAFLVHFARRCRRFQESAGNVHPVILVLGSAVLLQWLAEVLHLLHLQIYERRGFGESTFEASSSMLFMLSQVASCSLLIAIANGYTLLAGSKDIGMESVKWIAVLVALLHTVFVGHGTLQGDHAEKHHENEGTVGWAIVFLRLLLLAWFAASLMALRKQSQSCKLQVFLGRFQLAGSAYFLAYPAIYATVQVFAPYLQHPILHICTATMQVCAALWLSDLFLSRGAYFEASTLSGSLLPGGRVSFKAD